MSRRKGKGSGKGKAAGSGKGTGSGTGTAKGTGSAKGTGEAPAPPPPRSDAGRRPAVPKARVVPDDPIERAVQWLFGPQPIERLEAVRILAPLAIVGFMMGRILHADHWISDVGFVVPDLGKEDYRQPLYIPPVPAWAAWTIGVALATSGLMLAAGLLTRISAGVFCALLFYVSLADRLAAFTVSKLAPLIVLALFFSPCGARYGVDAWRRRRREPDRVPPTHVTGGNVRVFQLFLPVFYMSSGICKARGDWALPWISGWLEHVKRTDVLWTHLHDSYQTWFSYQVASLAPTWSWALFQHAVLVFELFAPLWFAVRHTRLAALAFAVSMHAMIGLMFGPVVWFSLLMISLLVASYLPATWLRAAMRRIPG